MNRRHVLVALTVLLATFTLATNALDGRLAAQEASWIWSREHETGEVPLGTCYFRKQFSATTPTEATIYIAADDEYELYLNGRRIGSGGSTDELDEYDVSRFVNNGRNLLAVKASNTNGGTAAMATHVTIKDPARGWQTFSSDKTWLTSLSPLPFWYTPLYNDARWASAQTLGPLGKTEPWDRVEPHLVDNGPNPGQETPESTLVVTDSTAGSAPGQLPHLTEAVDSASQLAPSAAALSDQAEPAYQVPEGFRVETILDPRQTGSLTAMTFNEFGHIVAAREDSELLLIYDSDEDGQLDRTRVYCDQVTNCQGILCLNGEVFVTGDGPDGVGVYRLSDENRDGRLEQVRALLTFECEDHEFGPHGLTLGPDGLVYVVVGSHAKAACEFEADSPYHGIYEGDLPQPRYEDPSGHGKGKKAPGGCVIRMDLDGQKPQLVAGGLRNAYDLTFSNTGELLTADGDMDGDLGSPWYRSSSVFHILPGGEYGWRSGWAKWPDYYLDRLPAALDVGRGAPTGLVVYDHLVYPTEYHGTLFMGEWQEGRILSVRLTPQGSTCKASSEVFVNGDSLNVSDLDVGPDGMLYFVTGGRGTPGGLYRVQWTGHIDPAARNLGTGLSAVIRQPQLQAAWARQKIATERVELAESWNRMIPGVALSNDNPWNYRTRALDLMQLYGPTPTTDILVRLSVAKNERVRGKAAELMGLHPDKETRQALLELLQDSDRNVRRKACEALIRAEQTVPLANLADLLRSDDRFEAWAARRLLERLPVGLWRDDLLASGDHRLLLQAGSALMFAHADKENALLVLGRLQAVIQGFVSDHDFISMLRLSQVAMHRGGIQGDDVPQLREQLAAEFPSGNTYMNRELIRLLTYLQVTSIKDRYLAHLKSDSVSQSEKLTLAMHLTLIPDGWTIDERIQVFEFLQTARNDAGGRSYPQYLMAAALEFAKSMSPEESLEVLSKGAQWPNAALGVLYQLPKDLDANTFQRLKELDERLAGREDLDAVRLKVGIVAVLARSGDPASIEHLRRIWTRDPERRRVVALGLAQWPSDENWDYLVDSLPILDGDASREVLVKLRSIDRKATRSEDFRQVILRGLDLKGQGAADAIALLEHWTGEKHGDATADWQATLNAWQDWYANHWPARPAATLPVIGETTKWHYDRLLHYLSVENGRHGDAKHGAVLFEEAMCAKCHRFGVVGEDDAPDLTTIAQRATRREILESILYPSQTIPPEMSWQIVITHKGRQHGGFVTADPSGTATIVRGDGNVVRLAQHQIDETVPVKISTMPTYLLDRMELDDVADLFAFLRSTPQTHLAETQKDTVTE